MMYNMVQIIKLNNFLIQEILTAYNIKVYFENEFDKTVISQSKIDPYIRVQILTDLITVEKFVQLQISK